MVIFSAVRDVLEKTKLRPSQASGFTLARGWNGIGFVHVLVCVCRGVKRRPDSCNSAALLSC